MKTIKKRKKMAKLIGKAFVCHYMLKINGLSILYYDAQSIYDNICFDGVFISVVKGNEIMLMFTIYDINSITIWDSVNTSSKIKTYNF